MLFESFEVLKVAELHSDNGKNDCEPITDDNEQDLSTDDRLVRVFWTVYGRQPNGEARALSDMRTQEDADELCGFLSDLLHDSQTLRSLPTVHMAESHGEMVEYADSLGFDSSAEDQRMRDEAGSDEWTPNMADALEDAAQEFLEDKGITVVHPR